MKKKIFNLIIILVMICMPIIVKADSGLDAFPEQSDSPIGVIVNSVGPAGSIFGELLSSKPGSENYNSYHIAIVIICLIPLFIATAVYIFKLFKKSKTTLFKLGISLIPTIIYAIFCFLTRLDLILYILILIFYIIIFMIIIKSKIKKKFKSNIEKLKELDKNFNEEKFGKDVFNVYKDIQIAWCNFENSKLEKMISKNMYDKYTKKLEELKNKNQKNIMHDIKFISNKITDLDIDNKVEIITCEMEVECYDYVIDDHEKVVKGKKDKLCKYTYHLVFTKKIKSNQYILAEKKMLKIS